MRSFSSLASQLIPVPTENIDTDRIIPARYLTGTGRKGLGGGLFADWRSLADGAPNPDCPLDDEAYAGAAILLAGDNFGCGSSREHAAWALLEHGIRVVLSTRFADIFRDNALRNGLLPVEIDPAVQRRLLDEVRRDPTVEVTVHLAEQIVVLPGGERVSFQIDAFSKRCLLRGLDQLGFLLEQLPAIEAWETRHSAETAGEPPATA
jgi:3-isopropylmalate/(R)-2-methylmalate dehydratase small subunit